MAIYLHGDLDAEKESGFESSFWEQIYFI